MDNELFVKLIEQETSSLEAFESIKAIHALRKSASSVTRFLANLLRKAMEFLFKSVNTVNKIKVKAVNVATLNGAVYPNNALLDELNLLSKDLSEIEKFNINSKYDNLNFIEQGSVIAETITYLTHIEKVLNKLETLVKQKKYWNVFTSKEEIKTKIKLYSSHWDSLLTVLNIIGNKNLSKMLKHEIPEDESTRQLRLLLESCVVKFSGINILVKKRLNDKLKENLKFNISAKDDKID